MLLTEESFREGMVIKEKCVEPEDFIRAYKDTDNEEIKGIVNEIMDAYFSRVKRTISEFLIFFDIAVTGVDKQYKENYNWCLVSDFFKMRELIYDDWHALMADYDSSNLKDGYWEFVNFTIEDMWKDESPAENLPSLKEIIETDYVSDVMMNYTKEIQKTWNKLPSF